MIVTSEIIYKRAIKIVKSYCHYFTHFRFCLLSLSLYTDLRIFMLNQTFSHYLTLPQEEVHTSLYKKTDIKNGVAVRDKNETQTTLLNV